LSVFSHISVHDEKGMNESGLVGVSGGACWSWEGTGRNTDLIIDCYIECASIGLTKTASLAIGDAHAQLHQSTIVWRCVNNARVAQ